MKRKEKRLNVVLDEVDYRAMKQAAWLQRQTTMKSWVQQAIREKLGRPQQPDPLDGLDAADRARVALYVELLGAVEDEDFRAAIDGVLALTAKVRAYPQTR